LRDILKKYSLRASITSELFFDQVRVPAENMLPEAHGLKAPLTCLTQARYGIAWGAIGAAIASYKEALDFAHTRKLFGSALTHKQTIQRRFADMTRRIAQAQLLVLQLGRLKDKGTMTPTQVSLAKWNNVRMGLDVCREARDILGAGGISIEFSPIRHMLNLESVITYEGTETIHELAVGRDIVGGINAF
jgi:glutaryl-CoA dehydrogenase